MAVVRVRQHVNPLSDKYQQPIALPQWEACFATVQQPLHLDIGCGRGHFVLEMASHQPDWNFLGLEIREPLVLQANQWCEQQQLPNAQFLFCNVNLSLRSILASLPPQVLRQVSIQFPDPWFKKRHQKRRVVQPSVVEALAMFLPSSGRVLLQSDVEAVAIDMCDRFSEHPAFARTQPDWLLNNPLPVATERERSTLARGEPVYRALFEKT